MRISCVLGRNICNLTTAMPVVASEGNMDIVSELVDIEANTCDRFNGTPLEGAVRHNFDMPQVPHVQRDNGATLAGEGLDCDVHLCGCRANAAHLTPHHHQHG